MVKYEETPCVVEGRASIGLIGKYGHEHRFMQMPVNNRSWREIPLDMAPPLARAATANLARELMLLKHGHWQTHDLCIWRHTQARQIGRHQKAVLGPRSLIGTNVQSDVVL